MPEPEIDTDVIVVGAGPTGLMLAGELRLGGARVTVLERLAEPTGESRGLGFTARTVEAFDQRGLLSAFGEFETSPAGHFGGLVFDFTVLEGAHFGARSVLQSRTEAVLQDWATGLGADLRRGWEFLGLDQDDDGVRVVTAGPSGTRELRAAYVVGCDGGQSPVRRAAGIGFPGTDPERTMYLADVRGCGLRPRQLGERVTGGMVMSAPIGGGVDRIIVCERGVPADRTDPVFDDVAAAWDRLTGEDISAGHASWVSRFGDGARLAARYRSGRVLLAGDAAHVHLPAGGQGLSTGVQDAVNLGWKLAAVVRGEAGDALLDTYHTERHPVGERLLANTRAQGVLFLRGAEVEPLREVFSELLELEEVSRHLAGAVSHLDIRYDLGPGAHPLLGSRLPARELRLPDGTRTTTTALLHDATGVLLDPSGDPDLHAAAAPWSGRVRTVVAAPDPDLPGGTTPLLVRPDGHVAWAGPGDEPVTAALQRWFGPPAAVATTPNTSGGAHDEF